MEKTFVFKPSSVCTQEMRIVYDDETNKIISYTPVRGCPGHGQGMNALLRGMDLEEAKNRLRGIRCPGSQTGQTSCPDQISRALEQILSDK